MFEETRFLTKRPARKSEKIPLTEERRGFYLFFFFFFLILLIRAAMRNVIEKTRANQKEKMRAIALFLRVMRARNPQ